MFDDGRDPPQGEPARNRVALKVVERRERRGFVILHRGGAPAYSGNGPADYVCGACAALLAAGVREGMFQGFVFACRCGALNSLE